MEVIKRSNASADGTCYQAEVDADYRSLVALFGRQNGVTDAYKVDAEWILETPLGIVTLYNYKTGRNYNGRTASAIRDLRDWHIGADSLAQAIVVKAAIEAYELARKGI